MAKKAPPVVEKEEEEEDVTCPVCGKPVGLDVASCPYCGAEFEEEEVAEEVVEEEKPEEAESPQAKAAPAAVEEDETAECPVCGKSVNLSVSSCPYCGAEFEEEEVEEVIEVEEKASAEAAAAEEEPEVAEPEQKVEAETAEEGVLESAEATAPAAGPSQLVSLKVIGISLIMLGIIGSQISVFIDWYWTWVPPIGDNLVMFIAIPAVIIIAALAILMYVRRSSSARKRLPKSTPGASISVLVFGILAMVMLVLWKPINDALQDNSVTLAAAFFAVLVIGILVVFMGSRMTARSTA
jgi:DNA-directed RNA polymerase subunit RPC12/RpoP/uncharacterized protein YhhL (DUF1145 family)